MCQRKKAAPAALPLFEVFPASFLFPRPLGLLHILLQARQQLCGNKPLLRRVAAELLVLFDGQAVGKEMLRGKVLKSFPAEAAFYLLFSDGFLGFHDKAALCIFLLRGGRFGFRRILVGAKAQPRRKSIYMFLF